MRKIFFASQHKYQNKRSLASQNTTQKTSKIPEITKQTDQSAETGRNIKKSRNYKKMFFLFGTSTTTQEIKDFILLKRILMRHISEMGINLSEAVLTDPSISM